MQWALQPQLVNYQVEIIITQVVAAAVVVVMPQQRLLALAV
jgi:hypothetical protein